MVTTIVKWVSLPALLMGSMFSIYAASYEFLLNAAICLGAIVVVQRAVRKREYFWAAALVAIAVVFSPLALAIKIFFLMGLTSVATVAASLASWKRQPAPAR
jgi:ATP/ADP translocase